MFKEILYNIMNEISNASAEDHLSDSVQHKLEISFNRYADKISRLSEFLTHHRNSDKVLKALSRTKRKN